MRTTDHVLEAYSGSRFAWAVPTWNGPRAEPWMLPDPPAPFELADGRLISAAQEVLQLVEEGRLDEIPFPVWFERQSGTRFGDLLWSGGLSILLVSDRFVEVLRAVGADGWRTYPVNFRQRRGQPVEGFVGLLLDRGAGSVGPANPLHTDWSIRVSAQVLAALRAAGVTAFRCRDLAAYLSEFGPVEDLAPALGVRQSSVDVTPDRP